MDAPPRIQVIHVTAPGCTWSWGYEPVFQRLDLVYGDQIDVRILLGCPYEDFDQWMRDYGMSWEEALAFFKEGAETMGVPILADHTRETLPWNVLPASLAAVAARRQEPEKARRFLRVLTRRVVVEGQHPTRPEVLVEAAREAGLDVARFQEDLADEAGIRDEYENPGGSFPHVPMGFYNVVVTDGAGRTVILDYAFDPRAVEEAIDYLSGGRLRKRQPRDAVAYVEDHGPAPLVEVARVFALAEKDALARLEEAEKGGRLERVTLAGAPHWRRRKP